MPKSHNEKVLRYIERIGTAVYQFADFYPYDNSYYIKTILTIILCLRIVDW